MHPDNCVLGMEQFLSGELQFGLPLDLAFANLTIANESQDDGEAFDDFVGAGDVVDEMKER